jgi:V/A-type H+/Na+-transporting ATPase subunit D
MARIRYNKTELKRQRDLLDNYTRFLPMLRMKKQRLQLELRMIDNQQDLLEKEFNDFLDKFEKWAELLDAFPDAIKFLNVTLNIIDHNVAGVRVPKIRSVEFKESDYDLFETPPWVDLILVELKHMKKLKEEIKICERQREILSEELKIVSRRVNLFEKVRIPQTVETIRIINIYLEERQKETVIRSKKCKEIVNKRKRP